MSAAAVAGPGDQAVALRTAHAAVADLLDADYPGASDEQLFDAFRELERLRRRLAAVDAALIVEAQARQLPESVHVRHPAGMLRLLLRLDPREATGRVRAAQATGARRALTGETLPPVFPAVAAAQVAGQISAQHARLITSTLTKLPDAVRAEEGPELEALLVGHARDWDPDLLAKLARRLLDCYDPDGPEPAEQLRHRNRDLRITARADGSSTTVIEATAELTEYLLTVFDSLAIPTPEADGVKDPRTAGQRRHDALREALRRLVTSEQLPSVNGVAATLIVTMTKEQYQSGRGLATTSHSALIPAGEALRWADHGGAARLLAVVPGSDRPVQAYSTATRLPTRSPTPNDPTAKTSRAPTRSSARRGGDPALLARARGKIKPVAAYRTDARLFRETQRLVLHAVHGGCTLPTCDQPPARCRIHHIIDYAAGGPTDVNTAAPVCAADHRNRIAEHWTARITGNRVAWIPPAWIDRDQQPRCNRLHHPWHKRAGP